MVPVLCPCSSHRHRHVSCARWVTLSSTSPFTSLPISSSLSSSCTSYCRFTFYFLDVVDYNHAHCRWGPGSPGQKELLHRLWAQRPLHHGGLCRVHPGVFKRATVQRRLRPRWHHHRSDAPQRVPKTSRSLRRRRPVVLSVVVVNESRYKTGKPRCLPWRKSCARSRKFRGQNSESEQNRTLLDRQREQILADCQAEIQKHEFQADYDRRSIQKIEWNDRVAARRTSSCLSRRTTSTRSSTSSWTVFEAKKGFSWSSWEKSQWHGRIEAIFRLLRSTQLQEEDWSKIKILSLKLTGKIQELQNEISCMNDSRVFQDAGSVRNGP